VNVRPIVVGVALALTVAAAAASERAETYGPLGVYAQAVSLVHDLYVVPISWDRLASLGIRGLVGGLDGDSEVLSPGQYRERTEGTGQDEGDIGLRITRRDHAIEVSTTIDGTPAAGAGLEPGDEILKIDGEDTTGMQPLDARDRLRGEPGTTVVLSVQRVGWAEPRSITVTRATAGADTVSQRDLGSHVLYVRIRTLEEGTARELGELLAGAAARDARAVVLDLRNSPGRSVAAAVKIAALFLPPGSVVARVESRTPGQPSELRTAGAPRFPRVPLAVLVNRGTVAAAEILASGLRGSGRSVTVGTTTFGDSSAQSLIPLSDGSALSLTTARYLTPGGHAIEGTGITPDFVVAMPADKVSATASSAALGRDPQLELALDITKAASIVDRSRGKAAGDAAPGSEGLVARPGRESAAGAGGPTVGQRR
jgi:carboxyl-terminal processing protease